MRLTDTKFHRYVIALFFICSKSILGAAWLPGWIAVMSTNHTIAGRYCDDVTGDFASLHGKKGQDLNGSGHV